MNKVVEIAGESWTRSSFVEYLRDTLIPDLRESGSDATADDFERCVSFMESGITVGDRVRVKAIGSHAPLDGVITAILKNNQYKDFEAGDLETFWDGDYVVSVYDTSDGVFLGNALLSECVKV